MPTIRLSKDEKCLTYASQKANRKCQMVFGWTCLLALSGIHKGMPWLSLSKPRYVIRYYPKIFFFSASNSASVRTPDSCNAPSCFNCSRPSSVKPVGCAGVATCG